uniref:Uncharacterized protein n=1 Tax=viral metagenome TaxID=1070528 RepID=A0A6C0JE11_9ZZZZ
MDYFYVIVSSIALTLLILLLVLLGLSLKKHSKGGDGTAWPPIVSTCPDYWKIDPSDPNYCLVPPRDPNNPDPTAAPRNTGSIFDRRGISVQFKNATKGYDDNAQRINFNDAYYTACNKQAWSKKNGIYWDGYSNYNGKC